MRVLGAFSFLILLSSCSSTSSVSSGALQFSWPVKSRGTITQKFKSGSRKHDGLDIAASKNTPILAAESGKILYAGRDFSGYGNLIIIEHRGDAWASFYAHLNGFKVREGQRVYRGQVIGLMGKSGRATGVHLHFELRHNLRPVNPLNFLSTQQLLTSRSR